MTVLRIYPQGERKAPQQRGRRGGPGKKAARQKKKSPIELRVKRLRKTNRESSRAGEVIKTKS